jgi:hypothetical protein
VDVGFNLRDVTTSVLGWSTGRTEAILPSVLAGGAWSAELKRLNAHLAVAADLSWDAGGFHMAGQFSSEALHYRKSTAHALRGLFEIKQDVLLLREVIGAVRQRHPGLLFMAEAYWDLEGELLQQGFDYCYDKRLYDRLLEGNARPVREHFLAELDYQNKLARFLENHDEPRAAGTFSREFMRLLQSSHFCPRGCDSFTRDNSRGERNAFRPISAADRRSSSTRR